MYLGSTSVCYLGLLLISLLAHLEQGTWQWKTLLEMDKGELRIKQSVQEEPEMPGQLLESRHSESLA